MAGTTPPPIDPFGTNDRASRRKCLLFAVAVMPFDFDLLERIYLHLPRNLNPWELAAYFPQIRDAVAIIEGAAEGRVSQDEMEEFRELWQRCKHASVMDQEFEPAAYFLHTEEMLLTHNLPCSHDILLPYIRAARALQHRVLATHRALTSIGTRLAQRTTTEGYSRYVEDIFGPSPHVAFASEWRSDTALSLAKHIYETRDFAQMPILADALQDAGCDNADILNHCRNPQQIHVRGCWVVDLVLGKE